jgi:hypothetical protein
LAYYKVDKSFVCGVCSRSNFDRIELVKNKEAKKAIKDAMMAIHNTSVLKAASYNLENDVKPKIILTKMLMMKNPELKSGFLNIFPNFKHGDRTDGLGMPSLSPKSMGPIVHNQPELPEAKNLENLYQANKVFSDEVDKKGEAKQSFFDLQIQMYNDEIPHRHKQNATGNVPLFSIWKDKTGKIFKLSYIESRQIYCHYYMEFALKDKNFVKLKYLINQGYNLNLIGYDAYQPDKSLNDHYLDGTRPFGHELVLYTLLTVENKEDYPWIINKTLDL